MRGEARSNHVSSPRQELWSVDGLSFGSSSVMSAVNSLICLWCWIYWSASQPFWFVCRESQNLATPVLNPLTYGLPNYGSQEPRTAYVDMPVHP